MSENDIQSIIHDPHFYAKAFNVYAKFSSKYQVLATWANTIFPMEVIKNICVDDTEKTDGKLFIMGIGSGTGEMDCELIGQLLTKYPKLKNTVVEPSLDHITEYKALSVSTNFTGVEWDFRQQTWDDYHNERTRTSDKTKFNFISAVHCLYYVNDLESAVLNIYDCLEDGGMLLIILINEESGFRRLWNQHPMCQDEVYHKIHSGLVQDIYKKHNIAYNIIKQPSSVNITSCFEEGDEEGQLLVDLLLHAINIKGNVSAKRYSQILEFMGRSECSVQKDGKILFNNDWDAIIVKK